MRAPQFNLAPSGPYWGSGGHAGSLLASHCPTFKEGEMEKEEFVKSLRLIRGLTGRLFDIMPEVAAHEFIMAIYLGKEGYPCQKFEYLYGRLQVDDAISKDWKRIIQLEYEALIEDMWEMAQEKFGIGLAGIVSHVKSSDLAELDRMVEEVEKYRLNQSKYLLDRIGFKEVNHE